MDILTTALEDRIGSAIATSPYLVGRKLRIETHAGRVTLSGVVHSYFEKQMAQEALRYIDGVALIDNDLEVSWKSMPHARSAAAIGA